MENKTEKFISDLKSELERAKAKFPQGKKLDTALTEEVGELAQALLHIDEKKGSQESVYREAIQVACVALRIAVEGCPEHNYKGMTCGYFGCEKPTQKRPCALCYDAD